jgi:hypothetical protein
MKTAAVAWAILRVACWALWFASLAYYAQYWFSPSSHLNSFGHLVPTTEALMFCLPLAAVFTGLFAMMMREWAEVPRVYFGRIWPPPTAGDRERPAVAPLAR